MCIYGFISTNSPRTTRESRVLLLVSFEMEGEINNLILVWTTVVASLCYCHTIAKVFPTGKARRSLAMLPITCLFLLLPLNLNSIYLGGVTSFFVAWLANFKLALFALDEPPLSTNPPIPLSLFIPLACLPIKIRHSNQDTKTRKSHNYVAKIAIVAVLLHLYSYRKYVHPHVTLFLYCLHIYLMLEMLLALFAALAKALVRVELEPQFDEPYLATSLQDFWGRRWNLMVSNVLHPTVYRPVRSVSARVVGRKWAPIPAVLAAFSVSGLMHELIFYNIGRLRPSGEMMCFFLVHGVSLSSEIVVKKMVIDTKFAPPIMVSRALTLVYVMYTSFWLFFPPFLRAKADLKGCTESMAFVEFVRNRRLVDPSDVSCPFI